MRKEEYEMHQPTDCKILLVDDNRDLQLMLTHILNQEGYTSLKNVYTCNETLSALTEWNPDFIILDIMLPDGDGFSLMEQIRLTSMVPVLFLSAKDEDKDRLKGLGLGADDYLAKPFLPEELLLRMNSILRRTYFSSLRPPQSEDILILGNRKINFSDASVTLCSEDDDTVQASLTAKELILLRKLEENRGKIVTFDQLSQALWGDSYYGYENSLMVHIRRLREKIEEEPSNPKWLLTARGLGYRLAKESASSKERMFV